jgi:chemotaxis protein CheD
LVEEDLINIGVAEFYVTHNPHILACFGLGSCVGVALYDARKKIGGLAHVMLPRDIRAKVVGGACMFSIPGAVNPRNVPGPSLGMQIGDRNIEAAKNTLKEFGIPLKAEDTGGSYGRTMRFDISNGKVTVSSIKHGAMEL